MPFISRMRRFLLTADRFSIYNVVNKESMAMVPRGIVAMLFFKEASR